MKPRQPRSAPGLRDSYRARQGESRNEAIRETLSCLIPLGRSSYVPGMQPGPAPPPERVPTPYDCHTIQVRATYFGVTTPTFTYYGRTAGFCTETARMIWIQPSSTAGFGPAGSLVVAGEARNAPAGTLVSMYYRNVTLGQTSFTRKNYDAPTDANGIWLNDIPNANPSHVYEVYATYDVITTSRCTYAGTNSNNWC
jgi:hypothetical protein